MTVNTTESRKINSSAGVVETLKCGDSYSYIGENGMHGEGFRTQIDALRHFAQKSSATFGRALKWNVHLNGHYLWIERQKSLTTAGCGYGD